MKVLKAGTKVTTVIGNIEALVVAVVIAMETVEYKIRYFSNGDERVAWLYRFEIEVATVKNPVGFNKKIDTAENENEINLIEG